MVIDKRHSKTIDLHLAHVADFIDVKDVSKTSIEFSHLIVVKDVAKRKHEPFVRDFLKFGLNSTANTLGWGVLALKSWEFGLEDFELTHETIKFSIGDA